MSLATWGDPQGCRAGRAVEVLADPSQDQADAARDLVWRSDAGKGSVEGDLWARAMPPRPGTAALDGLAGGGP